MSIPDDTQATHSTECWKWHSECANRGRPVSGLLDDAILGAEYPGRALDNVRDLLQSDATRKAIAFLLERTTHTDRPGHVDPESWGLCSTCEAEAVVALLVGGDR